MSPEASPRSSRKVRVGKVVSDKMRQTVVVQLTRQYAHRLYGKQVTQTRRVKAHDVHEAKVGDMVRIMETRPLSKTKRWRVTAIVARAE